MRLWAFVLAATLAGCATFPENAVMPPSAKPAADYRYAEIAGNTPASNSPRTLVLLAFSGGGVRASAMDYGVLEQLRKTRVTIDGARRSLLSEVDVISANSGGAYPAAYYGLFREQMFDDASPLGFDKAFLKRGFEGDILGAIASPFNWFRLLSPYYNRTDLAAEILGEKVFRNRTFKELHDGGRPLIVLNTNDLTKGSRFQFTQDYFDWLCSDLSQFPVARAVMASSAPHGLFGAMRMRNYTRDYCKPGKWVRLGLKDLEVNPRRHHFAKLVSRYYDKECWDDACEPDPDVEYFAFQNDGGTVDNLALRSLLWGLTSIDPDMSFMRMANLGEIDRVLLISVNAAAEPDSKSERSKSGLGPITQIGSAVNSAIDAVTFDSLEFSKMIFDEFNRRYKTTSDPKLRGRHVTYHKPALISFDMITDRRIRHCFKNIGTRLSLPDRTVDQLRGAGAYLLWKSTAFQEFLEAYQGISPKPPAPACTPG